jgi:lipopolysaccharide cholinephosphotransferase
MEISVEDLHSRLLRLIKEFHLLCVENKINYYIIGGTCLGARRHQGFIPWDDDIDVGVPREDYDRLCALGNSELPECIDFLYYGNCEESPFHYLKIIDNTTTLIERSYKNYIEGVYIDVFPLDGFKENSFIQKLSWKRSWFLHGAIINHCSTLMKRNFARKAFKYWAEKQDLMRLHNKLENIIRKHSFQNSTYVANFLGAYGMNEIVPRAFFGNPTLYDFEDTKLFGPEKIDEYLGNIYGDFMKLPPEDKRVPEHDYFYLDLNFPYKNARKTGINNI